MKRHSKRRLGAALLGLLTLMLGAAAALASAYAVAKARMPYNEEGRHFDGLVVHHAGSEYVHALLAVLLWAGAVAAGVAAYRLLRRAAA